jgi:hypothetical protein
MRRILAAGSLMLILTTSGYGQEAAEPGLFERQLLKYRAFFGYGGFEPELDTIFPEGYRTRWTPSVSASATYTDNVDKDENSRDAAWVDGVFGLGWLRRSPRLDASADYSYSTPIYRTENASGRDTSTQAAAAAVRWQALQHLSVSAGAHVTQNLEQGLASPLPGVQSSYDNRSDEYGFTGDYSWRASRGVTNRGAYDFSYRNFVSKKAQGEDSMTQHASEGLGWQLTARDRFDLGYDFASEETLGESRGRQNHRADASWSHRFLWFPTYRGASLRISGAFERGLEDEGTGFWSDSLDAGYSQSLSTRTSVGVNGGYKWIFPDEGGREESWTAGANASHRFSPFTNGSASVFRSFDYVAQDAQARSSWGYRADLDHRFARYTTGTLSASQSWRYEPETSTTDVTVLTRTREVVGTLSHRISRYVSGSARASYLEGDPGRAGNGPYWQSAAGATVTARIGRDAFLGAAYELTRRQSEEADEDFLVNAGRLFYRRQFLEWLYGTVRYSYERKDYDSPSALDGYRENRVNVTATATW